MVTSPEFDSDVYTLSQKCSVSSFLVEDRDVKHFDTKVHHTLPLMSLILSATDALFSPSLYTHSHKDAFIRGVVLLMQEKLISPFWFHITALHRWNDPWSLFADAIRQVDQDVQRDSSLQVTVDLEQHPK